MTNDNGADPYEKILKYIDEQRKMPHVHTNIALKELTWPPESKKTKSPPKDLSETFPSSGKGKDDADASQEAKPKPEDSDGKPESADDGERQEAADNDKPKTGNDDESKPETSDGDGKQG